jgi:hypothetical protein
LYPKTILLKLSPLIAQYLQINKSVTIEGLGRFYIDENHAYSEEPEKGSKSGSPVLYEPAPHTPTDSSFIDFVVKETGKIRPLAIADMDSYTSLAKQLLNISKPFVIEGVGTLVNNNKRVYDFIPGNFEPPRINTDNDREKKLRAATETYKESSTDHYQYSDNRQHGHSGSGLNIKRLAAVLGIVAVLGIGGWAAWKFLLNKQKKTAVTTNETTEGVPPAPNPADTSKAVSKKPPVVITDSNQVITYKVIHEVAGKDRAEKRFKTLQSYNDKTEMEPRDSGSYKLFVRVTSAARDTSRKRDSVRANYKNGIYKGPVYIEL